MDPRETVTSQAADLHLKLIPGTDGALALSMGQVIIEENLYDHEFVEKYVYGFEEYRAYVQQFKPEKAAEITGLDADLIRQAARILREKQPCGGDVFRVTGGASYQWNAKLSCGDVSDRIDRKL